MPTVTPIPAGTYTLGPEHATLTVRTRKAGAASKAGHNLLIEVTSWTATLEVGDDPASTTVKLSANSHSLKVLEGTGGIQALGDDDRVSIKHTIDTEVLKGGTIEFCSSACGPGQNGGSALFTGDLELLGKRRPLAFELHAYDDGHLSATATVRQTDWGIKPYSALFGTLKVVDEVQVWLDGRLPPSGPPRIGAP
ncbi:MAG: YceI family protein, partial [Solirubrobacteraceae bacterium]